MATKTVKERVAAIHEELTGMDLNSWEKQFLANIVNYPSLSEKQEKILVKLEDRAGIEKEKEKEKENKYLFEDDGTLMDYPF